MKEVTRKQKDLIVTVVLQGQKMLAIQIIRCFFDIGIGAAKKLAEEIFEQRNCS